MGLGRQVKVDVINVNKGELNQTSLMTSPILIWAVEQGTDPKEQNYSRYKKLMYSGGPAFVWSAQRWNLAQAEHAIYIYDQRNKWACYRKWMG